MAFKISPFHMETNGSPFKRRDKSKKEVRLSKKLEKAENQEQEAWEKADGGKKEERKIRQPLL